MMIHVKCVHLLVFYINIINEAKFQRIGRKCTLRKNVSIRRITHCGLFQLQRMSILIVLRS